MTNYFSRKDVRNYIEEKILNSQIENEYFPFINIPNFLPDSLYQQVISQNPFKKIEGERWNNHLAKYFNYSEKTKYEKRYQFDLKKLDNENTHEFYKFWRDYYLLFSDQDWFLKLIQAKFYNYFKFKYGHFFNDENYNFFESKYFLQRHKKGYELSAHTDVPQRTLTALFSFPSKKGFEEYGTNILVPLKKNQRCTGFKHHNERNFKVVKKIDYSPNNFFIFFNTEFSFHSVSKFEKEIIDDRFGMQIQFFEKDNIFEYISSREMKTSKNIFGKFLKKFSK
tara:strand:- start:299 stop:1141 length:843 start_codon:yes stop_codon:yes gene_type:complete